MRKQIWSQPHIGELSLKMTADVSSSKNVAASDIFTGGINDSIDTGTNYGKSGGL